MLVKPLCEVVLWTLAAPRLLFPIDFNAPRAYPLNSLSSNSLVVGDFNGDHIPDLAVTAYDIIGLNQGSGVEIFLGGANGLFHAGGIYQLPSFPGISSSSIVAGDFNHDGNLDLATVTQVGVSILFGNGDGTFQPSVNYSAGTFPTAVAMSDFNGDGNLDLAISNQNSNNVSILLGQADGTFQPAVNYAVGVQPVYVAAGEFNHDGTPDLVVANYDKNGYGTVSILFGVGDGTFHAAVNHKVGLYPQSIAVADYNRDGKDDLAITHAGGGGLSIMLALRAGAFAPPVTVATYDPLRLPVRPSPYR